MRRWIADRCRLALRKVLPRLVLFACQPTAEEFDRIVTQILATPQFSAVMKLSREQAGQRQTLH